MSTLWLAIGLALAGPPALLEVRVPDGGLEQGSALTVDLHFRPGEDRSSRFDANGTCGTLVAGPDDPSVLVLTEGGCNGYKLDPMRPLLGPRSVELDLAWFQVLAPGEYTLTVRSQRLRGSEVVSEPVRLKVLSKSDEELDRELKALVDGGPLDDEDAVALGYLGTEASVDVLLAHLDQATTSTRSWLIAGLLKSPHPERAAAWIRAWLLDPERAVELDLLRLLLDLTDRTPDTDRDAALRELAEAIPDKQAAVRQASIDALLWVDPAIDIPGFELDVFAVSSGLRRTWICAGWGEGNAAIRPILDAIIEDPGAMWETRLCALQRLYGLDPKAWERGMSAIRWEHWNRGPSAPPELRAMVYWLPEEVVQRWEDALLARLTRDEELSGLDWHFLEVHGSAGLLPSVPAEVDAAREPQLIAYQLRVESEETEVLLRELGRVDPGLVTAVADLQCAPVLEELGVLWLRRARQDRSRRHLAGLLLERCGGAEGQLALWNELERLSARSERSVSYIRRQRARSGFEALARPIVRGQGWVLDVADYERLLALAPDGELAELLAGEPEERPVSVSFWGGFDDRVRIGALQVPLERVDQRLSLYPAGTAFQLRLQSTEDGPLRQWIEERVEAAGHRLERGAAPD